MKLDCDILLERNGAGWKRPQKGCISIARSNVKGPTTSKSYVLTVTTTNTKKEVQFPLEPSMPIELITKFVASGRVSIMMSSHKANLYVSHANPSRLQKLISNLTRVLKGEELTVSELNSCAVAIRPGPKTLLIDDRDQYPGDGFPSTLEKLTITGINLQKIDGRWFSLSSLTELNLSNNSLAKAPNLSLLSKLSRFKNLVSLNLSGNSLAFLPTEVWDALPCGLTSLDLSKNLFLQIPDGIYRLQSLQMLRFADNPLVELPDELFRLVRLKSLDFSRCALRFLPYATHTRRNQLITLLMDGNPLLTVAEIPSSSIPSEMPPLEEIAYSFVLNARLDCSILPECLRHFAPYLTTVCSLCLSFIPASFLCTMFRTEQLRSLATITDGNRTVVLRLHLCLSCRKYF